MNFSTLARIGMNHARNNLAERLYLYTGYDRTRPINFSGFVNEHCNVKCRYCKYWRLDEYQEEMSIEEWQQALLSIKDFVGTFSISFSGGEPFIKPGFLDLMVWCHRNGIHGGVTTNGSALTPKNARKLVAAHPFNVNISVDAPSAAEHDYLRGKEGLFEKLSDGIGYVREEQARQGVAFPIMIKPTLTSRNFRSAPDMVHWAKEVGATCVNFQPVRRATPETYDELWIEEEEQAELRATMAQLAELKRRGEPIMNSEQTIDLFAEHFRERKATAGSRRNVFSLQNFFVRTNGDVQIGYAETRPVVGNIKQQSAREIWRGAKAQEARRQSVDSDDQLYLGTNNARKSLKDRVKMGLILLRN
jgi:MoaA/NifB/PqqE/SkfB family radical SAM enzyme